MKTLTLSLDQVEIGDRLRSVDQAEVERLAVSMADIGQLQPVEVMSQVANPDRYDLISGAHRMAAAQHLGWLTISASIFAGDPDQVRLREIDENLYRRELSPYDQAAFLAERADVCTRLGLLPKHGGARRGDQGANFALRNYATEIADKFGISRRLGFMAMARRRNIEDGAWRLIAGTKLADKGTFLDALMDVPRDKQRGVVEAFTRPLEPGERREPFAQLCHDASGFLPKKTPPSRDRRRAFAAAWKAMDAADREWAFASMVEFDRALARKVWTE